MKNSKSKFQELVTKMNALEEDEQGKLKGGITVLSNDTDVEEETSNTAICACTVNVPCNKPKS